MKRIAYLFKTHLYNDTIEYLINELYNKKPDNVDIYVLYNISESNKWADQYNLLKTRYNIISFDYKVLFTKYTHHMLWCDEFIGNEWMPLFDFYETHNEYDYYILTENDIWFNDINIFEIINKINKDVIYPYPEGHTGQQYNYWLSNDIQEEYNKIYDKENYSYVMLQFLGLSNNALQQIINEYNNTNYACHNEILIPSYIHKLNLSIDYLSNYCGVQFKAFPFDFNPIKNNTIYHPLKNINIILNNE